MNQIKLKVSMYFSKKKYSLSTGKKIRAASLAETLVAVLIMTVIYVFGSAIWMNLIYRNGADKKLNVHLRLVFLMSETLEDGVYSEMEWADGNYVFTRTACKYEPRYLQGDPVLLLLVTIKCRNREGKFLDQVQLVCPQGTNHLLPL